MGNGRAVVVGGSLAGLCAARVLAAKMEHVTVIDRDAMPAGIEDRPGVPQSRHVHALLARGLRELDGLFPGFAATLRERGAVDIDFGMDFAALREFGWAPRVSLGLDLLFASRALFEGTLRELFRKLPNVEILERTTAVGLVAAANGDRRVRGLRVSSPDAGRGDVLEADLVVDASGRGSKAPDWLREIGVEPPAESTVDSLAGYSTRWFAMPEPSRWPREWWWKGIWIDPVIPDVLRAGVLFPVEGRRWIVTLGGIGGNHPPTDEEGFMAELRRLRSPILAEAVALATPISPVYGNRAMANRRRHYERWSVTLPGFLAVADSACAFNPVYGQGMTAASICARVLERTLGEGGVSDDMPRRFFRAQARAQSEFWALATGADFLVPQTVGERPLTSHLGVPYLRALLETAMVDPVLLRKFVEVINMLRPASALFAPSTIARVGVGTAKRWLAGKPSPIGARPPSVSAPASDVRAA